MTKTPLLIIGDAPSAITGLGRICRDLALNISTHMSDIFEIGTLGYGGFGDRTLPFPQYSIEGMKDWFLPTLPDVWNNFAGDRKGVVLTIWDASRLLWFARPDNNVTCPEKHLRDWLQTKPFEKWGYFPMDAYGPNNRLSFPLYKTVVGYDRVICYSEWAKKMVASTLSTKQMTDKAVVALPHGIHTDVFRPRHSVDPTRAFHSLLKYPGPPMELNEKVIGIVATNQSRKDYGLAIAAVAEVAKEIPVRLFIHIDVLERHWSIPTLLMDYGLMPKAIVNTGAVTDEVMSYLYSACDVTLGIGPEGFGYPIFESLACGTPVIAGDCGGHAEHMEREWLLPPKMTRLEGVYNCVRPVYEPSFWARQIKAALGRKRPAMPESLLPTALDWKWLWPRWEAYLREQHGKMIETSRQTEPATASMP